MGLERGHNRLREPGLDIDVGLHPALEGILVGGQLGQHGPAVRPPRIAGLRQQGQITPGGHGGDAEALLHRGDAHRALLAQQLPKIMRRRSAGTTGCF